MNSGITQSRKTIAAEAAEWFVELRGTPPSRAMKDRFTAWLTESPVHVEEYLAVAKVFGDLESIDPHGAIDPDTVVDETIVALHGIPSVDDAAELPDRRWRHRLWPAIAASGLLAAVAVSVVYLAFDDRPVQYTTALGEQRSVLLDDGSMVSLNTSTAIEVDFSDAIREVRLLRGEALFDVEKDPARAFLVETRSAAIRVTGTQFNVYERDAGTAVTVIEGKVDVAPRDRKSLLKDGPTPGPGLEGGAVARLAVGEQALVKSGSVEIQTRSVADLEPVTAWTERRLVFDSTPLNEIVAQFNRYNRVRLVVDDAALASLRLNGVFSSNDPEMLVLFLGRMENVDIVRSADGAEIRIHAAGATR